MNNFFKNNQKGFTIVETLVAVAIFSVAISTIISVSAQGISSAIATKNRLAGNYLAQEVIEYVRHTRDKYAGSPVYGWAGFVKAVTVDNNCLNNACTIHDPAVYNPIENSNPSPFINCPDIDCNDHPVLVDARGYYYQTNNDFYNGTRTPFLRFFKAEQLNPSELKITATVKWTEKNGAQKSITLTETLADWRPTN
jgi:prepilin-type N-terminal cleavage/methylation domain-containing protein